MLFCVMLSYIYITRAVLCYMSFEHVSRKKTALSPLCCETFYVKEKAWKSGNRERYIAYFISYLFSCVKKGNSDLQIDVSFPCVCPVIDDGFRHNIVIPEWIRRLHQLVFYDKKFSNCLLTLVDASPHKLKVHVSVCIKISQ